MSPLSLEESLRIAFEHHQSGRLPQAEAAYRQVLAQQPNHAPTLHWLGVLSAQMKHFDAAFDYLRRAIRIEPNIAEFHSNLGTALREAGRLDEAIASYQRALTLNPQMAVVHNNLGTALRDKGRLDDAIAAYKKSLKLDNKDPQAHLNLGMALAAKGKQFDALSSMEHALKLNPNYAEGHFQVGLALRGGKRAAEAAGCFERAVTLRPNYAEAHNALGAERQAAGRLEEAVKCYEQALAHRPNYAEPYNNLGAILFAHNKVDEALAFYRKALEINPNFIEALTNVSMALRRKGQVDDALAFNERALQLRPEDPEVLTQMGAALFDAGRLNDALGHLEKALAANPKHANALLFSGLALRDKNQLHEAVARFEAALAQSPNFAEAHMNLAMTLLALGDFRRGWQEYEWRWNYPTFTSPRRDFAQPLWEGDPLAGRTVLLHAEQGHGDTIQFSRYAPLAARAGGNVIVECEPVLKRLLQGVYPQLEWIAKGEPLPRFDVHAPLLSLPRVFGTTLESIPPQTPVMHADPGDVAQWRDRLAKEPRSLKVGLAWAGGAGHHKDRWRSIPLADLAPLGRTSGVRFYSLQKGPAASQAATPPAGLQLTDWTADLFDFADTASLIANLDLVITVDTAVAHLAAAMGKPVWTLLAFAPDFRWMLDRDDSPWYPTMRLFRQPKIGDWADVVRRVADELGTWPRQ